MTVTNLSTCDAQQRSPTVLTNVHSSRLESNYPSAIVVHNTSANVSTVNLEIYDAENGGQFGTFSTVMAPNSQRIISIPNMENLTGITPAAAFHYVIKATPFTGHLQHIVNNRAARLISDMTETCALSP